jgi:superfamily II DNA or RNA helicase
MESVNKDLEKVFRVVLRELIEEHPLFRLKYFGYDGYIHQAELFYKLAIRQPVRVLVADEIGLGKTVEALTLIEWGLRKGAFPNGRVLILVPRSLIGQWRIEATRMRLHPITNIESFEEFMPQNPDSRTVFIFKIDTAKKEDYRERLLRYEWDAIVVDEVHKLGSETQRLKLVRDLVERNPGASIIFLSATPHKGDDEHYIQLLSLLDSIKKGLSPGERDNLYRLVIDSLVFRRGKKQVNEVYEREPIFVDAELVTRVVEPTDIEKRYIEELDELTRELILRCGDERLRQSIGLLAMVIDKRGLSSPRAGFKTFTKIAETLRQVDTFPGPLSRDEHLEDLEEYAEEEFLSGKELDTAVESVLGEQVRKTDVRSVMIKFSGLFENLINLASQAEASDSKISELRKILEEHLRNGEKVIIFTEFADTADYVYEKLREFSKELAFDVKKITGRDLKSGSESGIEEVKEWLSESGPRVLVSTDVASEGLNLQYANVLVNFELPWSLVKLEQRTGRVWRLGQRANVRIYLMVLNHSFEEKIFKALYRKLAESVKARIIPSTLIALRSRDGLDLPASGVIEFEGLSPYKLWQSYKTRGEKGVEELVEDYLKNLKEFGEKLKKAKLYDEQRYPQVVQKRLEEITGFAGRREFYDFLCRITRSLGKSRCDDYLIDATLKEAHKQPIPAGPVYIYCEGIDKPVVVVKACVGVPGRGGACWLYVSYGGSIKSVKSLAEIAEGLKGCKEGHRGLRGVVGKRYEDLNEKIRLEVKVKQSLIQEILRDHIRYLEEATKAGLRKGDILMKPASESEVRVSISPLVFIVPAESVEEEVAKGVEEVISAGDITEEKLEVEAKGREILEKILSDKYELMYVGDTKAPFDYVARDRVRGETVFIELKTLRELTYLIFTENEKEFADRISSKCGYWVYVVDLMNKQVRGYLNPFTTGKLNAVKTEGIVVNNKKYYVYEEANHADEEKPFP